MNQNIGPFEFLFCEHPCTQVFSAFPMILHASRRITQMFVKLWLILLFRHICIWLWLQWEKVALLRMSLHKLVAAKQSRAELWMAHNVVPLYDNPSSQKFCQILKKVLKSARVFLLFFLSLKNKVKCRISFTCLLISLPSSYLFSEITEARNLL